MIKRNADFREYDNPTICSLFSDYHPWHHFKCMVQFLDMILYYIISTHIRMTPPLPGLIGNLLYDFPFMISSTFIQYQFCVGNRIMDIKRVIIPYFIPYMYNHILLSSSISYHWQPFHYFICIVWLTSLVKLCIVRVV